MGKCGEDGDSVIGGPVSSVYKLQRGPRRSGSMMDVLTTHSKHFMVMKVRVISYFENMTGMASNIYSFK